MKNWIIFVLILCLTFSLTACGQKQESVEITVFAAASLTESLTAIGERYMAAHETVTLRFNFDSSGKLLTQIQEGAPCDLFISAAPKQMNTLDEAGLLVPGSRLDLLENKVVLAVADNASPLTGFDQLAELLKQGNVMLAIGNSDVPVGQYTQKIFSFYGIDEIAVAGCLSYGSNVKEVTTAVAEGTVDCGIVYASDAYSAGLTVAASATEEMCGQVIYPAAQLAAAPQPEAAAEFLAYLQSEEAAQEFETVLFTPLYE